jgi:hypothetical protein
MLGHFDQHILLLGAVGRIVARGIAEALAAGAVVHVVKSAWR